jgi:hypothetical protein
MPPRSLALALALLLGHGLLPAAQAVGEAAPDTELLSGPPQRGFVTTRTAELTWTSPDPVSGWECTLDLAALPCDSGEIRLTRLPAGTHTFAVAAVDEDGNADTTPARRTWTVPRNDRALRADSGWSRRKDPAAYGGSRLRATRRGATLTARGVDVLSLALVATTGPRAGSVAVFLGRTRLGRFDLRTARRQHRRLIPVPTPTGVRSARLKVVVRSRGRPVLIEGLGVATWFTVPQQAGVVSHRLAGRLLPPWRHSRSPNSPPGPSRSGAGLS